MPLQNNFTSSSINVGPTNPAKFVNSQTLLSIASPIFRKEKKCWSTYFTESDVAKEYRAKDENLTLEERRDILRAIPPPTLPLGNSMMYYSVVRRKLQEIDQLI